MVVPTTTVTVTTPAPLVDLDSDGDGTLDSKDCAPKDPAIHPGAADLPDLAFVDSDCDGIDGQEAKAIFVSPLGNDTNPGTKAKPKRQISAAVGSAAGTGRYVLAAVGEYSGVVAATGVGIFGGYDATTWQRTKTAVTRITSLPQGLLADKVTGVTLQLLTVVGLTGGNNDRSSYGIRALNGSSLTLQTVTVLAGRAWPAPPARTARQARPARAANSATPEPARAAAAAPRSATSAASAARAASAASAPSAGPAATAATAARRARTTARPARRASSGSRAVPAATAAAAVSRGRTAPTPR